MKKILAVVAHPDDEVLGCGGTLLKHVQNQDEVYVVILGEGAKSRFEKNDASGKIALSCVQESAAKVALLMGWKRLFSFQVADNRFDSVDLLDVVKIIEGVKKEVNPDIVYTHHFGDLNIDHRITHEAVMTAFRPLKGEACTKILAFETPSSTEWRTPHPMHSFVPTVYSDISETIEKKCEAMALYESEQKPFPHPRSNEALITIAKRWGVNVGMEYAEAFMHVRELV